ncbi:hypothetical protein ACJ3XI_04080 [Litorimonas sp. RW-G-Af-16]|uniref:hypothetical protein n=1 Tax=Litorimonas sp. RW-G-Af-16 TaxID=3241168 RepID=UPI00390C6306
MTIFDTAPSFHMQHLIWLLSQPGIYISLVFYASAIAIWIWSIRKVIVHKDPRKRFKLIAIFYTIFFIIWIFYMMERFRFFSQMLGLD